MREKDERDVRAKGRLILLLCKAHTTRDQRKDWTWTPAGMFDRTPITGTEGKKVRASLTRNSDGFLGHGEDEGKKGC